MRNFEKYKTEKERYDAFYDFCNTFRNNSCIGCQAFSKARRDKVFCVMRWLDLEAEEEKPLPCPFCGGECRCESFGDVNKVECQNGCACHYQSGGVMSRSEAISAHNRVAKAVMESEAK